MIYEPDYAIEGSSVVRRDQGKSKIVIGTFFSAESAKLAADFMTDEAIWLIDQAYEQGFADGYDQAENDQVFKEKDQ